jgi:nuclear GTP-binding protein
MDTQDLMVHYNLPAFAKGDYTSFLSGVARTASALKKGGNPDLTYAARIVLRDWATGKLPYYTNAPPGERKEVLPDADEAVLKAVKTKKEMRKEGGLVLIARGELETRKVELEVMFKVEGKNDIDDEERGDYEVIDDEAEVEGDDDSEEEDGGDDDGEEEDGGDDDSEEDGEDEVHDKLNPAPSSRKRKTPPAHAPPPPKKVAFASGTQDRNEKRQARKDSRKNARAAKFASVSVPEKTGKFTSRKEKPTLDSDAYDFDKFFKA